MVRISFYHNYFSLIQVNQIGTKNRSGSVCLKNCCNDFLQIKSINCLLDVCLNALVICCRKIGINSSCASEF